MNLIVSTLELVSTYARGCDRRDIEGVAALFQPAGSLVLPGRADAGADLCNGSWSAGYTNSGYTASCTVSGGLPGSTEPYQFRVRITCVRAARPNVTVYGHYSDWKSSANCASGYDPTGAAIQWVHV